MPTVPWVVPDPTQLDYIMSQLVLNAAELPASQQPDDATQTTRATQLLAMQVARIRDAIATAGKVPHSQTVGTVPPGAQLHAMVLAVNSMTAAKPNLGTVVVTLNGGVVSPWLDLVKSAQKYVADCELGKNVPYPSDPQVNSDGTPASNTTGGGDVYGEIDMSTDDLAMSNQALSPTGVGPYVPSGVQAIAVAGSIIVLWNSSAYATGYNVYRGTASSAESITPVASLLQNTQFVDTAVVSGTTYYYVVAASNIVGLSAMSSEVKAQAI